MKPSINYSKEDPKLCLLKEILNIIDDKKTYRIIGRLDVHNINKFQNMIKILLGCMFFDYTISNLVHELNRQNDLQTYFNIDEVPTEKQVYEFMSKVSPETINNMVNSILKPYYSKNRDVIVRYTVDATPVEVDINTMKQYVKPEHLDDLKLKWGYSKTKGNYIGYKVTVTIDNKSKCPISILIHPGSPHDSKIFDNVLKELKRRRLFKKRTIILFDKSYYSYKNYKNRLKHLQISSQ